MKYIISENQRKFLMEHDPLIWVKRRATKRSMISFIDNVSSDYAPPFLCSKFKDEFEYADNIINWAVSDFLTIDEDLFNSQELDEYEEIIVDLCKQWFAEELFDYYRSECHDEDMDDEIS